MYLVFTATLRSNLLGAQVESESYAWPPGSRREYHVISRGLIANEVVRRVDPRGRTVGQILRYHISEPLGADAFIGLNDDGEI